MILTASGSHGNTYGWQVDVTNTIEILFLFCLEIFDSRFEFNSQPNCTNIFLFIAILKL